MNSTQTLHKITPAEKTVGILLASGMTKKEVANELKKSEKTVCRQTDSLYKKTGARNLADITRTMISRYAGISSEEIIFRLMKTVVMAAGLFLIYWAANETGALDTMKAAIHQIQTSLIDLIK